MTEPRVRWGRRAAGALIVSVVVVAGLVVGARVLLHSLNSVPTGESCTVGPYQLDTQQAVVASQMVGVTLNRQLPQRASVLVLMAGLQESKLRNLASGQGDRDSVGVLQQRPSQGWGTIEQLSDVHFATGAFLTALVKVLGWQTMPLDDAIQAVQISADGSAYAKHEGEAQALSDALTGAKPATLTCTFPKPTVVAGTAKVASEVTTDLPVSTPTTTNKTVTVPGAGWPTATWFVANADRLGIESVDYANRTWSRGQDWKNSTAVGTGVTATMYGK
jgi:hypothetical protein